MNIRSFMLLSSFALTLIIAIPACTKKMRPNEAIPTYFILGSGGGVSGQYVQYKVHDDGIVEWFDFKLKKYMPYSTMTGKLSSEIWSQLELVNLHQYKLDKPGNYTYYIELVDGESSHKVMWNDESGNNPKALRDFFSNTERTLKQLK